MLGHLKALAFKAMKEMNMLNPLYMNNQHLPTNILKLKCNVHTFSIVRCIFILVMLLRRCSYNLVRNL